MSSQSSVRGSNQELQSGIGNMDEGNDEAQEVVEEKSRDVSSVVSPMLQPLDEKSIDSNSLGLVHLVEGQAKVDESPRTRISKEALVWLDLRLKEHEQRIAGRLEEVVQRMNVLEANLNAHRDGKQHTAKDRSTSTVDAGGGGSAKQAEADGLGFESAWSTAAKLQGVAFTKPVVPTCTPNEAPPQKCSLRRVMVDVDALNVEPWDFMKDLKERKAQRPSANARSKSVSSGRLHISCSSSGGDSSSSRHGQEISQRDTTSPPELAEQTAAKSSLPAEKSGAEGPSQAVYKRLQILQDDSFRQEVIGFVGQFKAKSTEQSKVPRDGQSDGSTQAASMTGQGFTSV